MEYFCGLCVCVIRLCTCILVSMCTWCAHEKAAGGLQVLCSISLCLFPRDRVSHWPRLEVSAPWFSSVCPLKHWGYIGMAAPNVRKNLITIILGGGSCAHASWFFLSIFPWAMRTEQVATLSASTSVYMDTGNLNSGVLLLECSYPPFQPHRFTRVVLWDRHSHIYYLSYLSFQVS